MNPHTHAANFEPTHCSSSSDPKILSISNTFACLSIASLQTGLPPTSTCQNSFSTYSLVCNALSLHSKIDQVLPTTTSILSIFTLHTNPVSVGKFSRCFSDISRKKKNAKTCLLKAQNLGVGVCNPSESIVNMGSTAMFTASCILQSVYHCL